MIIEFNNGEIAMHGSSMSPIWLAKLIKKGIKSCYDTTLETLVRENFKELKPILNKYEIKE